MRRSTLIMLVVLAGCEVELRGPLTVRAAHQGIQGGVVESGNSPVVTVLISDGICTGSLIAPNLVLTAQHCVADLLVEDCQTGGFGPVYAPSQFRITPSATAAQNPYDTGGWPAVDNQTWFGVSQIWTPGNNFCGYDFALLRLTSNITSVCPLNPRVDAPVTLNEAYTAVGSGATSAGGPGAGTRRRVSGLNVLCPGNCGPGYDQARDWEGGTTAQRGVCEGDSGGPALDSMNRVIGAVSRGPANACNEATYISVFGHAAWIKGLAASSATAGGYAPAAWVNGGSSSLSACSGGGTGGGGGTTGGGGGSATGGGGGGGAPIGGGGGSGGCNTTGIASGCNANAAFSCDAAAQCYTTYAGCVNSGECGGAPVGGGGGAPVGGGGGGGSGLTCNTTGIANGCSSSEAFSCDAALQCYATYAGCVNSGECGVPVGGGSGGGVPVGGGSGGGVPVGGGSGGGAPVGGGSGGGAPVGGGSGGGAPVGGSGGGAPVGGSGGGAPVGGCGGGAPVGGSGGSGGNGGGAPVGGGTGGAASGGAGGEGTPPGWNPFQPLPERSKAATGCTSTGDDASLISLGLALLGLRRRRH